MKSLYHYSDYRSYLQDYYQWAKQHLKGFSHRSFLQKAQMSGPNYLKRVMEGEHNLTDNSIPKFARALGLSTVEESFFRELVLFNQATSLEEKDRHFATLVKLKEIRNRHVIDQAQYEYYRQWYNVALREALSFFRYENNPDLLGRFIEPRVSASRVKKSLALLESLGLIEKRDDGSYVQTARALSADPGYRSLLIPKFHESMARLGMDAIDRHPTDVRNFTSVTMSLSEESYRKITEILTQTRARITERVDAEPAPDRIYHLNLQLFPLSRGGPRKPGRRPRVRTA